MPDSTVDLPGLMTSKRNEESGPHQAEKSSLNMGSFIAANELTPNKLGEQSPLGLPSAADED